MSTHPAEIPLAVITGSDLLERMDAQTAQLQQLATRLDSIPAQVSNNTQEIKQLLSQVTVLRTQLRAAWLALGGLLTALGIALPLIAQL